MKKLTLLLVAAMMATMLFTGCAENRDFIDTLSDEVAGALAEVEEETTSIEETTEAPVTETAPETEPSEEEEEVVEAYPGIIEVEEVEEWFCTNNLGDGCPSYGSMYGCVCVTGAGLPPVILTPEPVTTQPPVTQAPTPVVTEAPAPVVTEAPVRTGIQYPDNYSDERCDYVRNNGVRDIHYEVKDASLFGCPIMVVVCFCHVGRGM